MEELYLGISNLNAMLLTKYLIRCGKKLSQARIVSCAALALLTATMYTELESFAESTLRVGNFSGAKAGGAYPDSWEPLTFEKIDAHTQYELVEDQDTVVLKAESSDSSSGLVREIAIDPAQYPIVEWRWKVNNVLQKGDVTQKAGDDYPARIYITFAYDKDKVGVLERAKYRAARLLYGEYPPLGAINYIWANQARIGTVVPNPYTDRVQMVVLQSGTEKVGEWVTESHNVYDDYIIAFGEEPPMIQGVAVMTDTDNTHESAVAWFGDIVFRSAK